MHLYTIQCVDSSTEYAETPGIREPGASQSQHDGHMSDRLWLSRRSSTAVTGLYNVPCANARNAHCIKVITLSFPRGNRKVTAVTLSPFRLLRPWRTHTTEQSSHNRSEKKGSINSNKPLFLTTALNVLGNVCPTPAAHRDTLTARPEQCANIAGQAQACSPCLLCLLMNQLGIISDRSAGTATLPLSFQGTQHTP